MPPKFIARLTILVPKPLINLTRFHWVFVPNSKRRARVLSNSLIVRFEVTGAPFPYLNSSLQWVQSV